jgi:hypothetical protein
MAGDSDALADTTENHPGFGLSWIIGPEPDPSVDALAAPAIAVVHSPKTCSCT